MVHHNMPPSLIHNPFCVRELFLLFISGVKSICSSIYFCIFQYSIFSVIVCEGSSSH